MKVTKKVAAVAAVVGVCVLATTSLAVYNTGNGYDNLKKAILGTAKYTNCTVNAKGTLSVDGNEYVTEYMKKLDVANKQSHVISNDSYGSYYEGYYTDGKEYSRSPYSEGFTYWERDFTQKNLWGMDIDEDKTLSKAIRFFELGMDTVVGDLKSNIVCTESNDEYTSYSLELDYMQIPELVQAGLGVIGSSYSTEGQTYEVNAANMPYLLGEDPIVNSFAMDYTINNDGTLRNGEMRIEFSGKDGNGQSHTANVKLNVEFTNVGTTVVEPVDVSNAESMSWEAADEYTFETE